MKALSRIPVSEVRKNLSGLLKKLQDDPGMVIEITVNGMTMGELKAPTSKRFRIESGSFLLKALKRIGEPDRHGAARGRGEAVSERHDEYLYVAEKKEGYGRRKKRR